MSEKMELAIKHVLMEYKRGNLHLKDGIDAIMALRASSPAQEPVTTEPVAWTNEAQLGFLKEPGYRVVPMAMWAFQHSAHPIALYTIPAPPQPRRDAVIHECIEMCLQHTDCNVEYIVEKLRDLRLDLTGEPK